MGESKIGAIASFKERFLSGEGMDSQHKKLVDVVTDYWKPPTWFQDYGWFFILLLLLLLYSIVYLVHTLRERAREREVHMEAVRSLVRSFPSPTLSTDEEVGQRDTMCTICLSDFSHESVVSLPECGHVFHTLCIESYWLRVVRGICPNCRHVYYIRRGGS